MKKLLWVLVALFVVSGIAEARGGFSSGGGGRSSFSSGSRSFSSSSSSSFRPSTPSYRPSTTTTTTSTRTYSSRVRSYGGGCCGGMGMGYGYYGGNGLLEGMIIGSMMHPNNTVVYTGGGTYSNNALLYPDGRVVNQQGYVVGNYVNGAFTPVTGGEMVARPIPAEAMQPQPVVINEDPSGVKILVIIMLFCLVAVLIFAIAAA